MDNQREKLIELIREANKKCVDIKNCKDCVGYGKGGECFNSLLIDHLLANGVIALPCDKGTKLNYNGIDYELDHWNILASAFNDKAKEQGKSKLHLFDVEEAYKAMEDKNE